VTPAAWVLLASFLLASFALAQAPFSPPRLPDGHPDLQGVWLSGNLAPAFNIEDHPASYGTPAGRTAVIDSIDGKLPYLPAAREKAKDNAAHRERDPVGHCNMHGVPRGIYTPFPVEIVQDSGYVVILYETEHDVRIIPTDGRPHLKNYSSWEGDSRGRWEGDTLIVDVTGFNGKTWLDQAGNFVDENEHVTERFTFSGPDTITYEATVEDPTVYSRPWTLRVPLKRRPKDVELLEYGCIEGERDAGHYPGQSK